MIDGRGQVRITDFGLCGWPVTQNRRDKSLVRQRTWPLNSLPAAKQRFKVISTRSIGFVRAVYRRGGAA